MNGTTTPERRAPADAGQVLLQLDNVTLRYAAPPRATTAIDRVSLSVARGERVVLLGPSGCGKSSLLRAVAGFIQPAGGTIRLDGRLVRHPGPDRIMVFQEFDQLLPWRTAKSNVMLPLTASGRCGRRTAAMRAAAWLDKVGLRAFADAFPHQLSGGMKQRVALARALALEPAILLMDEPFAALDALTRSAMQAELLRLWDELRFTMLFVTHSIEEAVAVGHRIAVLTPGPGRIREEFDVPGGPGSVERAALLDHINRLVLTAPTTSGVRA